MYNVMSCRNFLFDNFVIIENNCNSIGNYFMKY